ncbi:MAG: peptidoglycan-binding protein [Alphaproteobacteria bacterium]|nr:peptidoglycan-binding protein [Alphaproteobacteria bacterium]MBV8409091.1 peptidoglycan-binding protein [Alphaproteobacteria bacterium]
MSRQSSRCESALHCHDCSQTGSRAFGVEHSETFDEGLDAVVRDFQREHQLTVDGVVRPMTRRALGL